ncbi:MAG: hypothetical protein ACRD7E_18375 [Bryobacteraceae bacterium]
MEHDTEITAGTVLKARRSRGRAKISPSDLQSITSPDARQIRKAARRRFARACDAGIRKRLGSILLEPANPFYAKAPRRPRKEAVVLGSLLMFAAAMAIFFNLSALPR